MSAPLPDALRTRFQRYIEEGLSGRAAALRLKLSPATGARWALAIRRTGRALPATQGRPRGKGKLDPHRALFTKLIAQDACSGEMETFTTELGKIDRPSDSHLIALSNALSKRAVDRKRQYTENFILFESALLKH